MVEAIPVRATVRSTLTELATAKISALRGFVGHGETLRAITAGRRARTTLVVSRLQTPPC